MRPLFGTIVGVGVFGLPYAFAQAGYGIGLLELLAVGGLTLVALLLYADLLLVRKDHGRYLSVVGKDLNPIERGLAGLAFFGSQFGTLLAYLIAGGSFAYGAFSPFLHGNASAYVIVFWAGCSVLLLGGASLVLRVQGWLLPLLGFLVVILAVVLGPQIHVANLLVLHPDRFTLPFGIALFAFGGIASIPEIRDLVHGDRKNMYRALSVGILLIFVFYVFFTLLVVSVTGESTTEQALEGLSGLAGPFVSIIGNLLGLAIVTGAFLAVGTSLTGTFVYDLQTRFVLAWGATVFIPLLIFLAGATNLVSVIGVTGGILAALMGVFLIIAYERARNSHELAKNTLAIPQWLVLLTFLMYAGMVMVTIFSLATLSL
jgi:amino acid permease